MILQHINFIRRFRDYNSMILYVICLLPMILLTSCTVYNRIYYGIQGYHRYETDLGVIYIPDDVVKVEILRIIPRPDYVASFGYTLEDKIQGKKFGNSYTFKFADSSFFYIGLGAASDMKLTYHISDTLQPELGYLKAPVDGTIEYKFYDDYFEDTWIDTRNNKLNKTIAFIRKEQDGGGFGYHWCCGMFVAGYQCLSNSDTTKYEQAIRSISWKTR